MKVPVFKIVLLTFILFQLVGCTVMHHTQISEVDSRIVRQGERFELLVSETGVNLDEAGGVANDIRAPVMISLRLKR